MLTHIKIILLLCISIFLFAISACSGDNGNDPSTIFIETGTEDARAVGEFPIAEPTYQPAEIEITSPNGKSVISTEDNDDVVTTIEPDSKWELTVKGTIKMPRLDGKTLDAQIIYVNRQRVENIGNDYIRYIDEDNWEFSKNLTLEKADFQNMYYPIIVEIVDEKNFLTRERTVVILQNGHPRDVGEFKNCIMLKGNSDFIANQLNSALKQIEGQNLAELLPRMTTDPNDKKTDMIIKFLMSIQGIKRMVPRNVMLQGIEIEKDNGFRISATSNNAWEINLNLHIDKMIAEYSVEDSPKGKRYLNFQVKDISIKNGFTIRLEKQNDTMTPIFITDIKNMDIVAGANFKSDISTVYLDDFIGIWNYMKSIINFILPPMLDLPPLTLKVRSGTLERLLKVMSGDDSERKNDTIKIGYFNVIPSTGIIEAGINLTNSNTSIKRTYTFNPEVISTTAELKNTNSTFTVNIDYLNQILGIGYTDYTGNSLISGDELNTQIEEILKQIGADDSSNIEIWKWIKNNGNYPGLKIKIKMKTMPIIEPDKTGESIGALKLRNTQVDIVKDTDNQLLVRLSIDMDLSMKWENGKLSLSCDKKDMQFNFLFNKLYPFFMPEQIYDVSQIMTESLSILINKLAFTGYHIKGIKTNSQGHVIFNADYNLERDLNSMDCYEYSNGKFYKKGSDTPATVTVKKNGSDLINDIFTSKSEYLTSFAMEHNTSNLPVPGKVIDAVSSNLEKNGGAVLTESGIKFKINEGNLNWDDSMAYQFELNELDEDNFIGHISFLATIDYSENTDILNAVFPLQYYNEYAVIGISYHSPLYGSKEEREMREQSRKDFNLPPDYDYGKNPSIVPKTTWCVPYEFGLYDFKEERKTATWQIALDVPMTKNVGISIRLRKAPLWFLMPDYFLKMSTSINNIRIYTADMGLY